MMFSEYGHQVCDRIEVALEEEWQTIFFIRKMVSDIFIAIGEYYPMPVSENISCNNNRLFVSPQPRLAELRKRIFIL